MTVSANREIEFKKQSKNKGRIFMEIREKKCSVKANSRYANGMDSD
jgi:hypothetical protein